GRQWAHHATEPRTIRVHDVGEPGPGNICWHASVRRELHRTPPDLDRRRWIGSHRGDPFGFRIPYADGSRQLGCSGPAQLGRWREWHEPDIRSGSALRRADERMETPDRR